MEQYPILLEEQIAHGNAIFPCAVYQVDAAIDTAEKIYCHWHHELELLFILEGNAVLHIGDHSHPIHSGDFAWIPSNAVHMVLGETNTPFRFIAIVFHPELIQSFGNDAVQDKYLTPLFKWQFHHPCVLSAASVYLPRILDIVAAYQEKTAGYELFIKTRLLEICSLVYGQVCKFQVSKSTSKNYRTSLIKDMMLYLQAQYNKAVTLSQMAAHFHISKGHLCRFFKEMTNMSPFDYLNYFRVSKSARLLRETDLSVSTIADQTGFNNISYYNRTFRKYMHMTPGEYRRSVG